jgi:hypothetical protein
MPKSAVMEWRASMDSLKSDDKSSQDRAFESLSAMTEAPVDWAYDVWDELLGLIAKGDNRQRAIAGQVLCNLAKSDPKERMVKDTAALLALTRDERFVTARHCLLSLWKIAIVGARQRMAVVDGLVKRFKECGAEKNGTLIRYDIQCTLRRVYDAEPDEKLRATAEGLIALEEDAKYRKKYATAWRGAKVAVG